MRDCVLDWLLEPRFLKPPSTVLHEGQPARPRRCASMEGNAIWSQLRLDLVDRERTPRLVERLLQFQWPDGGWNCDRREEASPHDAVRRARDATAATSCRTVRHIVAR